MSAPDRRAMLRWALTGGSASLLAPVLAGCAQTTSGPATRGAVTVGTAVDIINFDPYSQTTNAILTLRSLNAWLVNYDEQLRPHPDVLESFSISPDRTSVTLRIRPDVQFTTGRRMTVDDVLYALDRAADPERGFNLNAAMSIVDSFTARNAREIVIALKEPTSPTLITDLLASQPILDRDRNNSAALASEPASAGPFRLAEWRQGESLLLEANPDWYKGRPRIGQISIEIFTNTNAMLSALESGQIDVAAYVPVKDAERIQKRFPMLSGYPGAATMLLRVNTLTPPFDNRVLRQAIQHAVHRSRIAEEILFGFGSAASLPWGPESGANDPSFYGRVRYDLDEARRLLEASGAGSRGTAMVDGVDTLNLLVMQVIQADLAKLGFDLQIEKVDTASFQSRLSSGEFGVVLGQMGGGQLSLPRIVQNSLFRLSNNPLWAGGVPPQPYLDAMHTLTTTSDSSQQQAAYRQLNETIVEEAWAIGTYYVPTLFAAKPELRGLARDYQNSLVLTDAHF